MSETASTGLRWQIVIWREGEMWKNPEVLLKKFLKKPCEYKCWAEHEGRKSGKRHYHCYIRFKKAYPRAHLKTTFGENIRMMNGDDFDNANYISEQGTNKTFHEEGLKKKKEQQNAAVHVDDLLKSGKSLREIILEYPEHRGYIGQNRWVLQEVESGYNEQRMRNDYKAIEQLRDWQQHVLNRIAGVPDPRRIHWYVDPDGNNGKTTITDELVAVHGAVEWKPLGRDRDCSYTLLQACHKRAPKLIVCDLEAGEYKNVCWAAMERAKNGKCMTDKYEGGRYVGQRPHMLVFSNETPKGAPLTAERLMIYHVKDQKVTMTDEA